jgi:hypothetical protein
MKYAKPTDQRQVDPKASLIPQAADSARNWTFKSSFTAAELRN